VDANESPLRNAVDAKASRLLTLRNQRDTDKALADALFIFQPHKDKIENICILSRYDGPVKERQFRS
jgi:hypothetical protein